MSWACHCSNVLKILGASLEYCSRLGDQASAVCAPREVLFMLIVCVFSEIAF